MKRKTHKNRTAFTLVELLTTLAIVGILLGLLIPALNQVGKAAAKVKQKAQFHAIEIGLETFSTDVGYYPRSDWVNGVNRNGLTDLYTPSHRLAEALVGRDGLGFHKDSPMRSDGTDGAGNNLYATGTFNKADRKGPYLELESANAVMVSDIYPASSAILTRVIDSYVLVDMYKQVKHQTTGKQIGMPILYYKANTSAGKHNNTAPFDGNTYNILDALGPNTAEGFPSEVPFTSGSVHPMGNGPTGRQWFYDRTTNPNFTTTNAERPYRAESFILHSAGPDGFYGNDDDIFNFDEGNN